MLIGLDARTIYSPTRRGTGKNLIDLYRHLTSVRPDWQVVAYHRQPGAVEPVLPDFNVSPRLIEMKGDRIDAWQRWRLPLAARHDGVDVLHCPSNQSPSWWSTPTVVTIHDLIPLDVPQGQPLGHAHRFEESVRAACVHATRIICPSNYTRNRLVDQFEADPGQISVIPWAADSSVKPVGQIRMEEVRESYGVSRPYVLHFGASDARKNTRRLLHAWSLLDKTTRDCWQLLVVGLDDQAYLDTATDLLRLGIQDSVCLHGFADEADLPALLGAAEFLAYPSLSEGFGLPMLDAWAARTAVLTSNRTSLPEVAGDAAVIVDPTDTTAIADGLTRLIDDPEFRARMARLGELRADHFTWNKTIELFAQTIEKVAGETQGLRLAA